MYGKPRQGLKSVAEILRCKLGIPFLRYYAKHNEHNYLPHLLSSKIAVSHDRPHLTAVSHDQPHLTVGMSPPSLHCFRLKEAEEGGEETGTHSDGLG